MTVWMNKEHGNIHFSVKEMLQEARELYDIDDPTNEVSLDEYYTCMTIQEKRVAKCHPFSFNFGAPATAHSGRNFHYTTLPAICQEAKQTKIWQRKIPNLCKMTT